MDEFRVLTADELKPVLAVWASLDWPVPYGDVPQVVQRLGWTLQNENVGITDLPVAFRRFMVGRLGDEMSSIRIWVTDRLRERSREGSRMVASQLPALAQSFVTCLGFEPTRPLWGSEGWTWDLPNGGQVSLALTDATIMCEMMSKTNADIERTAIRLGMTPEDEASLIG